MDNEPEIGWEESLGEYAGNPPTPRESGEVVLSRGVEWRVSSCENRIKAQFESWLKKNASRGVAETEADEGPDAANAQRSAFIADRGAGHYSWNGKYARSARSDFPGLCYLFYLLLRRCQPDITIDEAELVFKDNPRGCGLAIRWALGNSDGPAPSGKPGHQNQTQKTPKAAEPLTLDRR